KIELDPVARHPIKSFARSEQPCLDSLADPGLQIFLLVEAEVSALPLVDFGLEPQVRQIIATASAERNKMIHFPRPMIAERGVPVRLRCDNGPEFTSRHFWRGALRRRLNWCTFSQTDQCRRDTWKAPMGDSATSA